MTGRDFIINGKEYFVIMNESDLVAYTWEDTNTWQGKRLVEIYNARWVLATPYEAACGMASELWGDSTIGEHIATMFGYEAITSDDAECVVCGNYSYYEDMVPVDNWDYRHEVCPVVIAA